MKQQRQLVLASLAALISLCVFLLLAHVEVCQHLFNRLLGRQIERMTLAVDNAAVASRLCSKHRKILYGIFSIPRKAQTWAVVRQQSQCDFNNDIHSTVFVVGTPRSESDHEIVARESKLHGDVFILTCDENMNEGKSYTYFREALQQFPCFDFYAKVDDDTAFVPTKLSARILSVSNEGPLLIGRNSKILDSGFNKYVIKTFLYSFRDMEWLSHMENYTAGLLYILNSQAVRQWVALNPTQLYGDEDYRTSYYMQQIGAAIVNLDTTFHDYSNYETLPYQNHWKLEITHNSLAVHKCKSHRDLSDAFASICAV